MDALNAGRATVAQPTRDHLYGAWLAAVTGISTPPEGVQPRFARGAAFGDFRLGQAIAGYGQLRRSNVLVAGKAYAEAGCEMPHVYVDALPEVWSHLEEYLSRLDRLADALSFGDEWRIERIRAYVAKTRFVVRVLAKIVQYQLAGQSLPEQAARFVNQIVESIDNGIVYVHPGSAEHDGWYHDLFFDGPLHDDAEGEDERDSVKASDFVADIFTHGSHHRVDYVGVSEINVAVFVVDTGETPVAHVGPVARSYALSRPVASGRLTDTSAREVPERRKLRPWAASHTAGGAVPPLGFLSRCTASEPPQGEPVAYDCTIKLRSNKARRVELALLDGHSKPLARGVARVGRRWKTMKWTTPKLSGIASGFRVRAGSVPVTASLDWDVAGAGSYIGCAGTRGITLPKACDANWRFQELERRRREAYERDRAPSGSR